MSMRLFVCLLAKCFLSEKIRAAIETSTTRCLFVDTPQSADINPFIFSQQPLFLRHDTSTPPHSTPHEHGPHVIVPPASAFFENEERHGTTGASAVRSRVIFL